MLRIGVVVALVPLFVGAPGSAAFGEDLRSDVLRSEVPAQGQMPDETPIVIPGRPTPVAPKQGKIAFLGVPWGASLATVRRTLSGRFTVDQARTGPLGFKGRFAGLNVSGQARFTPVSGRLFAVEVGFGNRDVEGFLGEKYGMPTTTQGTSWLWRFSNGDLRWDLARKTLTYRDAGVAAQVSREADAAKKARLRDL